MNNSKRNLIKVLVLFSVLIITVFSLLAANDSPKVDVSEAEKPGCITIDFKDAEISSVLRVLSAKSGINIVAGKDVSGPVTIRLVDVPWEKALDVILRTYGFAYEREGNIIRVTTVEDLAKEELITQVLPLNYAEAQGVSDAVAEMLTERGKIKFDERTNLVIVTDIPTNIYKIEKVVKTLDSQTPQVEIEAKIVETTLGKSEKLGIDWQMQVSAAGAKRPTTYPWSTWDQSKMYPQPKADYTYAANGEVTGIDSDFDTRGGVPLSHKEDALFSAFPMAPADLGATEYFNFGTLDYTGLQATMEFLITRSDTEVLSNPRITTLNNQEAKITVGTKWPVAHYGYSEDTNNWYITGWEYIQFGILLNVTPVINQDNYITLNVKPEISDLEGTVDFTGAKVPIIATKQAEASVMIKDGRTLVIGGLIKDKMIDERKKLPILGDIPILSLLFSKKVKTIEKRELIIFITPRIIRDVTYAEARAQTLSKSQAVPQATQVKPQASQVKEEQKEKDLKPEPEKSNKGYF